MFNGKNRVPIHPPYEYRWYFRHTNDNIFHNALAIMRYMKKHNKSYGHMNCNDPPTYGERPKWHDWNKERRYLYKEQLFMFNENEQVVKADDGLGSYFEEYEKECAWQPDNKF